MPDRTPFASPAGERLSQRLERYLASDDPAIVADEDILRDLDEVTCVVACCTAEPPGWRVAFPDAHAAACLYWYRAELFHGDEARADFGRAMALFTLLFRDYPEAVPESALTGLSQAAARYETSELNGPSFWARSAKAALNRCEAGEADPAALHGAIMLLRCAVQASSPGTVAYAAYLTDLVRALRRIDRWATVSAIADEVREYGRRSAATARIEDPDTVLGVGVSVGILGDVSAAINDPSILDEAIDVGTRFTDDPAISGLDPLYQLELFTPTAIALHSRYSDTEALSDLTRAIDLERRAASLAALTPELQARLLSVLAVSLTDLFMRTEDDAHIREAVDNHRRALEALPPGTADHAEISYLLACSLSAAFRVTQDRRDLEQALEAAAYSTRVPDDVPTDTARRHGLTALLLRLRYDLTSAEEDLTRAAAAHRTALDALADDEPRRSVHLAAYAETLRLLRDFRHASQAYREAVAVAAAPAVDRLLAAAGWADCETRLGDHRAALDAYRRAIELLPPAVWHGLDRGDREHLLGTLAGLASDAAATALVLGDAPLALELIEEGRGVLLRQALDRRSGPALLRERLPAVARELDEVRRRIDAPIDIRSAAPSTDRDDRRRLAQRWDALVADARRHPGFESFLVPLSFDQLKTAAEEGPVVVLNVSELRSDALILTKDGLDVVPLREGFAEDLDDQAAALDEALELLDQDASGAQRRLSEVLSWLGAQVTGPVFDALGRLGFGRDAGDGSPLRLWWCPTGQLSFFPLHAAVFPTGDAVFDRCTPSYTVTLRTLLEGRHRPEEPERVRALVVCVPAARGESSKLLHADKEADHVAGVLAGSRLLTGSEATRDAVLEGLRQSSWFHFIGHAQQLSLAEGGAVLRCHTAGGPDEGAVTVADIAELQLAHPELAVLSACETAYGDIALSDEAAHLAGALQTAGFRHVVATQWPASDRCSRLASEILYGTLTAAGTAESSHTAEAVRDIARKLRAKYPKTSLLWAPYVHFGP